MSILVLGDSHADVFRHAIFAPYQMDLVVVGGATASGLANPNSQTQALPIFYDAVANIHARTVLVLLGEVDCGFVIWWRVQHYGTFGTEALELALQQYRRLLLFLRESFDRVVCISAPLPTLTAENPGRIGNLRREITATQKERTEMTVAFNARMGIFCAAHRIDYLNLDPESRGRDGLVRAELLSQDKLDHHYDRDAYAAMLYQRLVGLGVLEGER